MKKKILIVEDEPTIAQDIAYNLEDQDFEVVAIAHTSEKALDALFNFNPDLVLLDINIKGLKNGIEIAKIINEKYSIPFIYLTSFADAETVNEAAETLPYGYLVKPFKESDLAPAINIALAKSENVKTKNLPTIEQFNKITNQPLTKTEYLIIKSIFAGLNNQQIAKANFVSVNTVKTHLNNIFLKLEIHSKLQLLSLKIK